MFSKATPYSRPAPMKVKCVAKYSCKRGETFELVDGMVAVKSSKMIANCALCDGETFMVAHLKNEDCHRIDENQTYFLKGYNMSERYGSSKFFFTTSTVFFKTSELTVSPELELKCRHAICPPSPVFQNTPNWIAEYCTISGAVASLSTPKLQMTKDGAVPLRQLELTSGRERYSVSLWRDVALEDIELSTMIDISHLHIKRHNQGVGFNSTTYTTIKKSEMVPISEEVEVVGICHTPTAVKILTASMDELTIPPHIWSGDTDEIISQLPIKMFIVYSEGIISSIDCPLFSKA